MQEVPHKEALIASMMIYRDTNDEKYLDAFYQILDYCEKFFADEYGEWYGYLRRDGKPTQPACKGSTFKGPFHVPGKFRAVSDSHMQMYAAATMGKEDVIVQFSYSGATTGGLQILEYAKSRGIRTVLVSRFHKSPAAKLADVVLRCGSNEGPFQFGSVPAKIAQLVVMDVLFQEYCYRNQEQCEENIQSIASALSGMHI